MSGGVKRGVARDRDYGLGAAAGCGAVDFKHLFLRLAEAGARGIQAPAPQPEGLLKLAKTRKLHKC
jgi:hypothetical protein